MSVLHDSILAEFEKHTVRLREASRNRKNALEYTNLVDDNEDREAINIEDTLGKRQPNDTYNGDVNLRTLRTLLKMIDERGWERYVHALLALRVYHARFTLSLRSFGVRRDCPAFKEAFHESWSLSFLRASWRALYSGRSHMFLADSAWPYNLAHTHHLAIAPQECTPDAVSFVL